jgi:carboxypeptidase Taq
MEVLNMNTLKNYHAYLEKVASYELALNTLYWDQLTIAPKNGQAYRNKMMSILSGELFDYQISEDVICLLEAMDNDTEKDTTTAVEVKQILKDLNRIRYIPREEFIAFTQLLGDSEMTWENAKETNNWDLFKPFLKKVIHQTKKNVGYRKSELPLYQQLLNDFEPGMSVEAYDEFFKLVKKELVPLIHKINAKNIARPALLDIFVSITKQREVIDVLAKALHYSKDSGYVGTSVHPFSSRFTAHDNRVTVSYDENSFTTSIFSFIHEVGHATYNGQVNPAYEGRFIANSMSYGLHESQSRMYENMLGRSKQFWQPLYPKVVEIIKELEAYTLDEFIFAINYVSNSLIRTDADEVTYPLHVLVRYEIEKALFANELLVEDLPEVWNQKMKEYLEVTPPNYSLGVLQDVHWPGGSFGYFPTYALGSAYSAQFYHTMADSINIDKTLSENRFDLINDFLKTTIHQYGGLYTAPELFEKVCHAPFNQKYYIDYLVYKYSTLYKLD